MPCRNRLGELPRACSQLTDYPSRLSKTDDRCPDGADREANVQPPEPIVQDMGSGRATLEVELMGIEPTTSGLQNRRSPS